MSANSVFCSIPDSKILPEKIVADINLGRLTHTKFLEIVAFTPWTKTAKFRVWTIFIVVAPAPLFC